ncbi:hypothetical protein AB0M43_30900 [Longispora sp. NPDC051575]|uniref:hypothetical protein n=1 Tax=Longispora sp. NPDC051575 TaxID=3154943 RepID=UPI003443DD18
MVDNVLVVRSGARRWWLVAGGFALAAVAFGVGVWFVHAGLEDADRWASVLGVFLNLTGLVVASWSAWWARRAVTAPTVPAVPGDGGVVNTVIGGRAGAVVQGRCVDLSGMVPSGPAPAQGSGVSNRVEQAEVDRLLIQGRDIRGPLPPAGLGGPEGTRS